MKFFVISKGRYDNMLTSKLLNEKGIEHTIVVEPQEESLYSAVKPKTAELLVLPCNDRGIIFVRQFVLNYARENKIDFFSVLDDDISSVGTVKNKRCIKGDARLLNVAADIFKKSGLSVMGLQYQQFAWCATKPFNKPTHCDCACFFNTDKLKGCDYDEFVKMKEDWDFSLQVLKKGGMTAVLNKIWMSVPTMGTNKGGLFNAYAERRDFQAAERLLKKWGDKIISLKYKMRDGEKVIECKVDWKYFEKKGR